MKGVTGTVGWKVGSDLAGVLVGRTCLLEVDGKPTHSKGTRVEEYRVMEVSPMGKQVRLLDLITRSEFWTGRDNLKLVDVLQNRPTYGKVGYKIESKGEVGSEASPRVPYINVR